jgi:hypothetical protein
MGDGPHTQRVHVPVEVVLLDRRKRVIRLRGAVRRRVKHVVDVGDVPANLGFHA